MGEPWCEYGGMTPPAPPFPPLSYATVAMRKGLRNNPVSRATDIRSVSVGCLSGQVRSGHVVLHIESKLLQRTPVTGTGTGLRRFLCPGRGNGGKKGEGNKGDSLHWRVQGSTSSPTGIGSRRRVGFEVLWNWECHVGLSQKRNMCAFQ